MGAGSADLLSEELPRNKFISEAAAFSWGTAPEVSVLTTAFEGVSGGGSGITESKAK